MYHYRPEDGYFGDPIPFFWKGEYHLFYLKAPLEPKRFGASHTSYAHISTQDFLSWKEHPLVISPAEDQPDSVACWTGSIVEKDGLFYLFYTGYRGEQSLHPQSICLATSNDLDFWQKNADNPILLPDPQRFDFRHWRDPFVFWYEEEGCYMMSITTVQKNSIWTGGALVMARSQDLLHWDVGEVYYYPGNHSYPECSDLFKIGPYWYLVCSIFDKTCYRVGMSPAGPWRTAKTDSFDGVLNYAAKTLSDGVNHFAIGWIRTKSGRKDDGVWEWGGHMSFPRQLIQDQDGTLYTRLPRQFSQIQGDLKYSLRPSAPFHALHGEWSSTTTGIQSDGYQLYAEIELSDQPFEFDATFDFTLEKGTRTAGIVFNDDPSVNHPGYEIALDLRHQSLIFRRHTQRFSCYSCQYLDLETGQPVRLRVIVENGIVEIFVNDQYSLCSPFYNASKNARIRFFIEEGAGILRDAGVHALAEPQKILVNHLSEVEA